MVDIANDEEFECFKPKKSTDWKWSFSDYPKEKNGLKVFSCFACGGGSTMGYKLCGCEVLGCCEIDPKMNEVYIKNHNPKYNFLMDIREFNNTPNDELPEELFDLDILDGSPPCTTFSMAGEREESWGKKKKFREGQAEQTLDDLSFVFIETVNKLRPKTVIMENVEGLLLGNAWGYVQEIYRQFREIGYKLHHWLLKGETMGVPQKRHRVFFVAIREDLNIDPTSLDMSFNYQEVNFGLVKSGIGKKVEGTVLNEWIAKIEYGDKDLSDVGERCYGNPNKFFNYNIIYDEKVANTITAKNNNIRYDTGTYFSCEDTIRCQTFPSDYNFIENSWRNISYICGMSVPPLMIKRLVTKLIEQGVYDYKLKQEN
ncbi:MAG: DNA cytosine methyltransferase [Bacteroidales bacterium]|nr:DNA cytosine methyltransferase [Bacteroidales bacterium]